MAPSPTAGVPLVSQGSGVDPSFGTAVVLGGGTGATTFTTHGVLVGEGTAAVSATAAGSNGQVLLGSNSADPVFATLTGTGGITFTTGPGSLQINSTGGGLTWSVVTSNASFAVNTGTIANKSGTLTMTLPASAAIGDIIEITGINTALGWSIAQNANQQIFLGNTSTTVGVAGSVSSINTRDGLRMVCVVAGASTAWNVLSSVGNLTIV